MAGILISLLASRTKLSPGVTHSALLSLITGLSLVGLRYPLVEADPMKWEEVDNTKISIKLLIVLIILLLAFLNRKRETLASNVWSWIAALTMGNIIVALVW